MQTRETKRLSSERGTRVYDGRHEFIIHFPVATTFAFVHVLPAIVRHFGTLGSGWIGLCSLGRGQGSAAIRV